MKGTLPALFITLFWDAAPQTPDAATILKRTREAYTMLKSYEFTTLIGNETKAKDFQQIVRERAHVAVQNPAKVRIERSGMSTRWPTTRQQSS